MTRMDRILFGDNQFFGVNHMSEEKARSQAMRFRDLQSIIDVVDAAYELGIRTFMFTTHERVADIVRHTAAMPDKYSDLAYYPGMPYAHKYANMVGELGLVGTLREVASGRMVETILRGVKSTFTRDMGQLMRSLVDTELAPFAPVKPPVVFLQNVVADLLLGLGMSGLLAEFHEYVSTNHDAEAGFMTMNMPRMVDALLAEGVVDPIICCNYNAAGFRMCGGIDAYDRALSRGGFRCIAMSVLASGALGPEEAVRWICDREEVASIVFGASSRANIAQTIELITHYTKS